MGLSGSDSAQFKQSHPLIHNRVAEADRATPMVHCKASLYGNLAEADVPALVDYSQMAMATSMGVFSRGGSHPVSLQGRANCTWTYNSHGPVSSWNVIDWFGQPLMAYYSTKRADEPAHVMADTGFFTWGPGNTLRPSIFALNNAQQPLASAHSRPASSTAVWSRWL